MSVLLTNPAMAHCDTLSGPVVQDAQIALQEKDVTPVLKWIPEADEAELRGVFDSALAVRGLSAQAKQVADNYFFETLVRIHRASEGEPFTGLKPAGTVDPAIAAADRALADGNVDPLVEKMTAAVRDQIKRRFAEAHANRQTADDSVEQGREYVKTYVQLTHFVEGVEHIVSEGAAHLVPHGINQEEKH